MRCTEFRSCNKELRLLVYSKCSEGIRATKCFPMKESLQLKIDFTELTVKFGGKLLRQLMHPVEGAFLFLALES